MIPSVLVFSPAHDCRPELAIAGARAGACGVLDISVGNGRRERESLSKLLRFVREGDDWGVRWDTLGIPAREPACLREVADPQWPLLILGGLDLQTHGLGAVVDGARSVAKEVFAEAYSADDALAFAEAGFDGLVLVGNESGGRVSAQSTFVLLQQLYGKLRLPFWVRGGAGPQTAAAARLAGASGVVLGEQLWLAEQSPFSSAERDQWRRHDAGETRCVGDEQSVYRFSSRLGGEVLRRLEAEIASGGPWKETLKRRLLDPQGPGSGILLPMGQDIGFAAALARKYRTVGGIVQAFQSAIEDGLRARGEQPVLAPGSSFARTTGVEYPIFQEPIPWVSDVPGLAHAVAEQGATPFLALGMLRPPALEEFLTDVAEKLAGKPWGIGLQASIPPDLRKLQLAAIRRWRPTHALVLGGSPGQARELERAGISTYLQLAEPESLAEAICRGQRKFALVGNESGGHVGACSNFILWQSAVDILRTAEVEDCPDFAVVFGGGIHDALSAAMLSVVAAPLAARGIQVGVLMGTAYLLTREAAESGAITQEFQRRALECRRTTLLASGPGQVARSIHTPFVEEFEAKKRKLILAGKNAEEIQRELEAFCVGRARIAAKGVARQAWGAGGSQRGEVTAVDVQEQRRSGLYLIGEAATLQSDVRSIADLHDDVSRGSAAILEKQAKPQVAQASRRCPPAGEPLAIVGMGCMFPRSPNLRAFWQNILRGFDAVDEVPRDRWRVEDFYDPDRSTPDRFYAQRGAFLGEVVFDPLRYRMPPNSIASIEPIQLLALEVARAALEDAGYQREGFPRQRTAVIFAAAGTHDHGMGYAFRTAIRHWLPRVEGIDQQTRQQIYQELDGKLPQWTEDSFAGFLMNVVAGRIANRFDLRGANFTVDAACASGFAALETAAQQLRAGTCDAVLVGAIDGTNNPFCFMSFSKTHAMSPSGRSRPFDENADGIGLGEGVAAMVLKRLDDAERDGDRVYAVVRGIGSSSDGKARSMTAPYADGQLLALRRAYDDASISPASVTLIESHGTGTTVGDAVEVEALTRLFALQGAQPQSCAIGSVKSMIGHTKAVAGLASLIKAALAVKHKILPPTIGVRAPNRALRGKDCPFYVCSEVRPWRKGAGPRRAGVSAFGFGGTNYHVVVEEHQGDYYPGSRLDWTPRTAEIFCWTSRRRQDLLETLREFARQLAAAETDDLAQLGYSVYVDQQQPGEHVLPRCRLALVATSVDDLREKVRLALTEIPDHGDIDNPAGLYYSERPPIAPREVCYLFPGQGSQSTNMLMDLVLSSPWAWDLFEQAELQLAEFFDQPLTDFIYPIPVFSDEQRVRQQEALDDTRLAQPALSLMEVFATKLLARFGIHPGAVAGHSYGECVALWAAGVHSAADLLVMSAERGRAVYEAGSANRGAMASVFGSAEKTRAALDELDIDAELANINAHVQTVIAGPEEAIERAVKELPKKKLRARRIRVTGAFHTAAMNGVREVMDRHMAKMAFHEPRIPVYSNTTGERYPTEPAQIRHRLGEHITRPVLFAKLLHRAHADGLRVFLEVGPGNVLTSLVRRNLKGKEHVALSIDVGGRDNWQQLGHVLGQLAALGLPIRLEPWFENRRLSYSTTAELFETLRAENQRKPTDWVISPGGARPWSSPSKPKTKAAAVPTPARASENDTEDESATAGDAAVARVAGPRRGPSAVYGTQSVPATAAVDSPPSRRVPARAPVPPPSRNAEAEQTPSTRQLVLESESLESDNMQRQEPERQATSPAPATGNGASTVDPIAQFQFAMAQWLEVQKQQQQVIQQFLETQQAVMLAWLNGGSSTSSAKPRPQRAPVPTPVVPSPRHLRVAPAPVVPAGQPPAAPPEPAPAPAAQQVPPQPPVTSQRAVRGSPDPAPPPARSGDLRRAPTSEDLRRTPVEPERAPATPPASAAVSEPVAAVSAPVARKGTAAEGPPPLEVFRQDLLEAISDKTGYPIEMLDEKLELEAGLGIDSIKVIEIFEELSQYHAYLPGANEDQEESLAAFAQMRTIRDILANYEANAADHREKMLAAAAAGGKPAVAGKRASGDDSAGGVERVTLEAVRAPRSTDRAEKKKQFPKEDVILVLGEVPGLTSAMEAALRFDGLRVRQILPGTRFRRLADNRYELDLSAPEALRQLHTSIAGSSGLKIGAVFNFLNLSEPYSRPGLHGKAVPLELATSVFNVLKEFEKDLRESARRGGGWALNFTSLDGKFGLAAGCPLPVAQAVTIGMFKTVNKEWPELWVKNIDLDRQMDLELLFSHLAQEVAYDDGLVEVGIADNARWKIELVDAPLPEENLKPLELGPESVVLVTGGAYGITAEAAKQLAREARPRLILVGRSSLPGAEPPQLRQLADAASLRKHLLMSMRRENPNVTPAEIERAVHRILKDRQIRANIAQMQQAGSPVVYHAVDVRDEEKFAALIDQIYTEYGRLDGVVHGAGVIEDRLIGQKTPESFTRVVATKIDGALVLANRLRSETLGFLVFFSSVSATFGNAGQIDYSGANEYLNKLAEHLDAQWPARVVAINWGPWDGGMVSDELRRLYAGKGVRLIPPQEGRRAFLWELRARQTARAEVLLACDLHTIAAGGRSEG